jgi:hypothetical protein
MSTNGGASTNTQIEAKSKLTGWEIAAIAGTTLVLGSYAVAAVVLSNRQNAEDMRLEAEYDAGLPPAAVADGFVIKPQQFFKLGDHQLKASVELQPGCTVQNVRLGYVESGGKVTDISSYNLDVVTNPVKGIDYNHHYRRYESYLEGNRLTYTFANAQEFRAAAGSLTCAAIAENVQLQNSVDEIR